MDHTCCHRQMTARSRREFLTTSGFGFGGLALGYLLNREHALGNVVSPAAVNPLARRTPHFPAKGKSVICLYMKGGPSQMDSFDPKPLLSRLDGQPIPPSFVTKDLDLQFVKVEDMKLLGSRRTFRKYGQSGLEISDLFSRMGQHADDLAVIRSCYHDSFIHGPAMSVMLTGSVRLGHPSVGAWVVYGLGSETENLPAYVAMSEGAGVSTKAVYGAGFLPAAYQGTFMRTEGNPLRNLTPPIDPGNQRKILDQVGRWNQRHLDQQRQDDSRLSARLTNYELAFRMQTAAPELIDISAEPEHVRQMYGLNSENTAKFGRMCLLARRMVERGVRFIQLYKSGWDGHTENDQLHVGSAAKIDQPIAGLIADLKQRGLLDSTLLVWTGEFGRTPINQGKMGRDHNPYGFTTWMAGGGIRGGKAIGATDELGFRAVEDRVHVHDLHATILSLLGLDHEKLTYFFEGRNRRLTDVGGQNDLSGKLMAG